MRQDKSQFISTGTEKNVSSDMYGSCERGRENSAFYSTASEFLANRKRYKVAIRICSR